MIIYILTAIIVLLLLALVLTREYFKARITELEIYGYYARCFIAQIGLLEEWEKFVEEIEEDINK